MVSGLRQLAKAWSPPPPPKDAYIPRLLTSDSSLLSPQGASHISNLVPIGVRVRGVVAEVTICLLNKRLLPAIEADCKLWDGPWE